MGSHEIPEIDKRAPRRSFGRVPRAISRQGLGLVLLLLGTAAQAAGLSDRCRSSDAALLCPETCAEECDHARSSSEIRTCVKVLQAVRQGRTDDRSCNAPPETEPPPPDPTSAPPAALNPELETLCLDANFATKCPVTCQAFCDIDKPSAEQLKICRIIIKKLATREPEPSSCHLQPSQYAECQQRVENHFAAYRAPAPPEGALETVYEDRPKCATPLKKLLANFICLRDASRHMSAGVEELEERGLSGIDDIERLCSLAEGDLGYLTGLSRRLIDSGETLTKEFEQLETCRNGLIHWNEQLKAACNNTALPNCTTIVENLEKARQPMMDRIGHLATGMDEQLKRVVLELDSIRFFRSAALDCPPPGGTEGELSLDDVLGSP